MFKKRTNVNKSTLRKRPASQDVDSNKSEVEQNDDTKTSPESGAASNPTYTSNKSTNRSKINQDEEDETVDLNLVLKRRKKVSKSSNGIDLEKLNSMKTAGSRDAETRSNASNLGGLQIRSGNATNEGDGNANTHGSGTSFAAESSTVDSKRIMNKFIEENLSHKTQSADEALLDTLQSRNKADYNPEPASVQLLNPLDFLKSKAESAQNKLATEEEEGNITFSASLLSSIPEVDLGTKNKLKNIQRTEDLTKNMNSKHRNNNQRNGGNRKQPQASDNLVLDNFRKRMK